jgi:hypothetical protein
MGLISLTSFSAGTTILSADVNSNFSTISNDYNGSISNANISGSAAIEDTKLAAITTGGKVNFTALTVTSQTAGDVMFYNGTNWIRLAIGTANQVLAVNSGATAVEYQTATSAASQAEMEAATESAKYVAPSTMQNHPGVAKAWGTFDGTAGTPAISTGYNMESSITDGGAGDYTVSFTTDFSGTEYSLVGSATRVIGSESVDALASAAQAAGTAVIRIIVPSTDAAGDAERVSFAVFGDQ